MRFLVEVVVLVKDLTLECIHEMTLCRNNGIMKIDIHRLYRITPCHLLLASNIRKYMMGNDCYNSTTFELFHVVICS